MPFKILRFPSSTANQSKNSRLSFNLFHFVTGDTQKDSGLEIEIMLETRVRIQSWTIGPFGNFAKLSMQSRWKGALHKQRPTLVKLCLWLALLY